jgi:hypothetical protein
VRRFERIRATSIRTRSAMSLASLTRGRVVMLNENHHVHRDLSAETAHFFDLLYPDAPSDAWLVVSWPDHESPAQGTPPMISRWYRMRDRSRAERRMAHGADQHDLYFGVGLRAPSCQPRTTARGKNLDVMAIPGLWIEFDHQGGVHTATNLPTREELAAFLNTLPFQWSVLVDSTGGMHAYLLFRELWLLETAEERQRAQCLLQRFQHTVITLAAQYGWKVDDTADLARLLRPAGTFNHKSRVPLPVTVLQETAIRYNPADIEEAAWLMEAPTRAHTAGTLEDENFQPASLEPIVQSCAWLRHCRDDAAHLSEPEWYAARSIIARCQEGDRSAHEWSAPYPGYSREETDAKVSHALRAAGPRTCANIRQLGGEPSCATCPYWGKIRSPIVLGRQDHPSAIPGPRPADPDDCPELPAYATVNHDQAAEASRWLDEYMAFSNEWAPRGYDGFHEAVGLFVLATTAARRIQIAFGPRGVYTSLYLALAARTTLFTKTTVAEIGLELLRRAGLGALLADDESTPQAFLHSLTPQVPAHYDRFSAEERQVIALQLAFAAQRGWFYDEWGQQLTAMMQKDSVMASFRSIVRRLDDHKETYVHKTIVRGRAMLSKPYLTLLVNVTPADLKPFAKAHSPLWRDGYMARFAFSAPHDSDVRETEFPEGSPTYPPCLISALQSWHERLGIPHVAIESERDQRPQDTRRYRIRQITPLAEQTSRLRPDVRQAYYAYDRAMRELIRREANHDLDGSYARFPMKALRVAGLLASLHGDSNHGMIELPHWYRGQQIAERWRRDLHRLVGQVHGDVEPSLLAKAEQRILSVIKKHGTLTVRDIHRWTKLAYADITAHLETLMTARVVGSDTTARTTKYRDVHSGDGSQRMEAQNCRNCRTAERSPHVLRLWTDSRNCRKESPSRLRLCTFCGSAPTQSATKGGPAPEMLGPPGRRGQYG